MKRFPSLLVFTCLLCLAGTAAANPVNVDPVGSARSYTYALIAAGTIAVESAILYLFSRAFHESDCDLVTKIFFVALNIATLAIVLIPLLKLTHSVLAAEAGVVAVEAFGIRRIFAYNGIAISPRRALAYSFAVNLVSYTIGAMCQ